MLDRPLPPTRRPAWLARGLTLIASGAILVASVAWMVRSMQYLAAAATADLRSDPTCAANEVWIAQAVYLGIAAARSMVRASRESISTEMLLVTASCLYGRGVQQEAATADCAAWFAADRARGDLFWIFSATQSFVFGTIVLFAVAVSALAGSAVLRRARA